jgi:undecaprenyl-diphosphatase
VRGHGEQQALGPAQVDAHGWLLLAIGFVVSFLVAYAVVAWFMHWVRRRGIAPFAVWRILLGGAVLLAVWRH